MPSRSASHLCAAAILLLTCAVSGAKGKERYSNSWAVEVRRGTEKAEELARKHGFVNLGQVRIQIAYIRIYIHVSI